MLSATIKKLYLAITQIIEKLINLIFEYYIFPTQFA